MAKRATECKDDILFVFCEVLADREKESTKLHKHRYSQVVLSIINYFIWLSNGCLAQFKEFTMSALFFNHIFIYKVFVTFT